MSEQWARLPGDDDTWARNPRYDRILRDEGLVCAACHLRGQVRHGPPLAPGHKSVSQAYHGKPVRTPFFETSEFCAPCHQHGPGSMAPNGKRVENVYQEWLASPYAARGITCQKCHMPGRRHLWKGIHDPAMTRSGVTITSSVTPDTPRPGRAVRAVLTLRNSGTGHAFPTYTTPAVVMQAEFVDRAGRPIDASVTARHVLQRVLDMSTYPWTEVQDSRLMPGQSARIVLKALVPTGAASLRLQVRVEPDEFYSRFFAAKLNTKPPAAVAALYRKALARTLSTPYTLFQRTIPIRSGLRPGTHRQP